MKVTFQEVSVIARVRFKDANGRWRTKQKKIWQTVNPWNRHADGRPKTYLEVLADVKKEEEAWKRKYNRMWEV